MTPYKGFSTLKMELEGSPETLVRIYKIHNVISVYSYIVNALRSPKLAIVLYSIIILKFHMRKALIIVKALAALF